MLQRVIWIICLPVHWELLPIIQGAPPPTLVQWHDTETQRHGDIKWNNCLCPGLDGSQDSGQHQMKSSTSTRSPILILPSLSLTLSLSLSLYFLWGSSSNKYFSTSLGWLLMSPTYWGSPNDQPSNHQSQFYSICSLKNWYCLTYWSLICQDNIGYFLYHLHCALGLGCFFLVPP